MGGQSSKLFDAIKSPDNEATVRASFDSFDADSNGVLEGKEVEAFASACIGVIKKDVKDEDLFCRLLVTGKLEELTRAGFIQLLLDEAKATDETGKLVLTYEGFREFLVSHPGWENFEFLAAKMNAVGGSTGIFIEPAVTVFPPLSAADVERISNAHFEAYSAATGGDESDVFNGFSVTRVEEREGRLFVSSSVTVGEYEVSERQEEMTCMFDPVSKQVSQLSNDLGAL